MPAIQIRDLPTLRFACRELSRSDDLDLILAEAAALRLWAEAQDRTAEPRELWLLFKPESAAVATPVEPGTPVEEGIEFLTPTATRWRVAACSPTLESARTCAAELRAWPVSDHGKPLPDATLWLRLDPGQDPPGATLHLPLRRS